MTPPPKFTSRSFRESVQMKEFTWRAVLLGLVMCVVLGAANAYLGLRAGQTIAATYPAAVIGMAVLRIFKGSILEENIARTAGSIGESVAAGAVFTIPAFVMVQAWRIFVRRGLLEIDGAHACGQRAGRAVRVAGAARDGGRSRTCRSPNRWRRSQIHKAGQGARRRRSICSTTWHSARGISWRARSTSSRPIRTGSFPSGNWARARCVWAHSGSTQTVATGGVPRCSAPTRQPRLYRRRLRHRTGAGVAQFLGQHHCVGSADSAADLFPGTADCKPICRRARTTRTGSAWPTAIWRYIVRPIAVGGMMVGTCYTLFRMRKNLVAGLSKALSRTECRGGATRRRLAAPNGT